MMYLIQSQRALVVSLIVVFLCSCGGSGRGEESSKGEASTASLDITGTWLSNCYYDEGLYTVDQFVFTENTVEISYESFSRDTCMGTSVDTDVFEATYQVRHAIKTGSGRDAVEIDYTITYQGQTFVVLDLVSLEGNIFYYGKTTDTPSRPNDVDTDIIMSKKTWSFEYISADIGNARSPEIAFDGLGNAIAVWSQSFFESSNIWFNFYNVDDDSWGDPTKLESNTGDAGLAQIKFDSNNNATVIWKQGHTHVGDYNTWAIRYESESAAWSIPQKLEKEKGVMTRPQIAIDAAGDVIAVWSQRSEGEVYFNLWSNRYDAQTDLWGTAELIESVPGSVISLEIATDPSGNAIVVWLMLGEHQINIWANRYNVTQNKWGVARLLETDDAGIAGGAQIAMDLDGNALAIWHQDDGTQRNILTNQFKASTSSWGVAKVIDSESGEAWLPKIAFDQYGNALAVWRQEDGEQDNVWSNRFVAATETWEQPVLIESNNEQEAKLPEISVDREGNAIAVWQHHDGTRFNVWINRYSATQNGWGVAERIEPQNESETRYPKIVMGSHGKSIAIWQQEDGVQYRIRAKIFE